jgi:hypothetical protein
MALNIGSRIAHYDVTALIGEGGMPEDEVIHEDQDPFGHSDSPRRLRLERGGLASGGGTVASYGRARRSWALFRASRTDQRPDAAAHRCR